MAVSDGDQAIARLEAPRPTSCSPTSACPGRTATRSPSTSDSAPARAHPRGAADRRLRTGRPRPRAKDGQVATACSRSRSNPARHRPGQGAAGEDEPSTSPWRSQPAALARRAAARLQWALRRRAGDPWAVERAGHDRRLNDISTRLDAAFASLSEPSGSVGSSRCRRRARGHRLVRKPRLRPVRRKAPARRFARPRPPRLVPRAAPPATVVRRSRSPAALASVDAIASSDASAASCASRSMPPARQIRRVEAPHLLRFPRRFRFPRFAAASMRLPYSMRVPPS